MDLEILDFQLHEPGNHRDWSDADVSTRHRALTEMLLTMMESVGVDAVLLHPTQEHAWAEALGEAEPWRFGSVPMLHGDDPASTHAGVGPELSPHMPDIEEQIAKVYARRAVKVIRFVPGPRVHPKEFVKFQAGEYDRALAACEAQGVPILIHMSGGVEVLERPARQFPGLQIIVDHIGLRQPPVEPVPDPAWGDLPKVLALAQYPNVALKLCGAPGLSAEGYPFADIRPHVAVLLDAYGPQRLAWGSDISRFNGRVGWRIRFADEYPGKHTYLESLAFWLHSTEISLEDKRQILGGTARRLLKWPGRVEGTPT
jgi:predicted TIM-barrel fold metal-dependent hydrolase